MKKFLVPVLPGLIFCVFSLSCNGIFAGIYDTEDDTEISEFGFIEAGTIYINTSSYTEWTYIDFYNSEIYITGVGEEEVAPDDWDIAVHRFDTKTNGAAVLETSMTGLELFQQLGAMPEGDYVEDVWTEEQVIIDMSQMMDGILGYTQSYYNAELSKWINVDRSNMPPTYTMSQKVYAVKLSDGNNLALKLSNYRSASGGTGYLTIEYLYPVEF